MDLSLIRLIGALNELLDFVSMEDDQRASVCLCVC